MADAAVVATVEPAAEDAAVAVGAAVAEAVGVAVADAAAVTAVSSQFSKCARRLLPLLRGMRLLPLWL